MKMTLNGIGMILGVSRSRVHQIEYKAFRKIHTYMRRGDICG
jgi:DNA-directed RNA polymerase sigma subunit (sigma70/sigma32)